MNKFVRKILVFSIVLITYFGLNVFINFLIYSNQDVVLEGKRVLIVGDSHTLKGLDPTIFESAQNISQSAEPYILTYWKLKEILNLNKPDTLIVTFGHHNISEYNDFTLSDKHWASTMFIRSYSIENLEELENRIKVDWYNYYKTIWKQLAFYPKLNHRNFVGNYTNTKGSNLSNKNKVIGRHYFYNKKQVGVSDVAVSYLDSIINICNNNEIALILVGVPVHQSYSNKIPNNFIKGYSAIKSKLEDKQLKIIDKTMEVYPDSCFLDVDHLNSHGANRFTKEIIEAMEKVE
jgi:hypothetical protein